LGEKIDLVAAARTLQVASPKAGSAAPMDAAPAVHFVAEKVLARGAMVGLAAEQAAQKAY